MVTNFDRKATRNCRGGFRLRLDMWSIYNLRIPWCYPLFGNALDAIQAVGLGLASKEKIRD
ncbi:hypothetical protein YC2023_008814 [Brassica napus]